MNRRLALFSLLLQQELGEDARFDSGRVRFTYTGPLGFQGRWNLNWQDAERNNESFLRLEHPFAQKVFSTALERPLGVTRLRLDYKSHGKRIGMLEPIFGRRGWLRAWKFTAKSFDTEDSILLAGVDEDGKAVTEEQCIRLLTLPAEVIGDASAELPEMIDLRDGLVAERLKGSEQRNVQYLDEEQVKLDRWAEDLKLGLEQQIKEADKQVQAAKRAAGAATTLDEKLAAQKEIKTLEAARNRRRRELFDMQDKIEAKREELIEQIQSQMKQTHEVTPLFAFAWTLVS